MLENKRIEIRYIYAETVPFGQWLGRQHRRHVRGTAIQIQNRKFLLSQKRTNL